MRKPPRTREESGLEVNITHVISFVSDLEANLGLECAYRRTLEGLVAELMDATFESTDPDEKVRLAAPELRARLILDRWKKQGVN